MHSSTWPVLLCRRLCTVTQGLLGSLHFVCCAALLGAVHCNALCVLYQANQQHSGGQWNSSNALPHCLGAVGSGTAAMRRHTACGQRAVEILQCTGTLHVGSGQPNSCNSLPHCLWVVGSGSCNVPPQCLRQWAVGILQCTATLPVGSWP